MSLALRSCVLTVMLFAQVTNAAEPVTFQARTTQSGPWSDAATWSDGRQPQAGDFVQIRAGHTVIYDVDSTTPLRMIHVAGTLRFSDEVSTRLEVGLLKVEPGETTTEDGFNCHEAAPAVGHHHGGHGKSPRVTPQLLIGTPQSPLPSSITATVRLRHFPGTDRDTLPAIVVCGGRWEVHGAPLRRTWLKLAEPALAGSSQVILEQPVNDWRVGDHVIVTTSDLQGPGAGHSFQARGVGRQKPVGTESRRITAVDGAVLTLDRPLAKKHRATGIERAEVANLSRNIVVESAEPSGVRGHTMYHHGSSGGIAYAEFRHLGKDGVLGKYAIHFHLVRDTMRGSGVIGASIWDSHNRWITIHGTDHLLVRDCIGYQSRGHGFFLEDATEQWNVLDRNLAVQAFGSAPLPKQVLPYDPNDGAGFWWANGRNTLTRNVACENDQYGYHFQIAQTPEFDPVLNIRRPDGELAALDVRTLPFLRFEDNESHGDGLFGFRIGDEEPGSVRGDARHPFILRKLRAWQSHYALRPNVRHCLVENLDVSHAAYGIYRPDYDEHVYRNITFRHVTGEPLNGGHDEQSVPRGRVTYDGLRLIDCDVARRPLVQLTAIAPQPGLTGHFRGISLENSRSRGSGVVGFGGGPRTNKTEFPIGYWFHDYPRPGDVVRVSPQPPSNTASPSSSADWLASDARAESASNVAFPTLLQPIDDLPPATLITHVIVDGNRVKLRGVSHDNGEIAAVSVNGVPAEIVSQQAGVADWQLTLDRPSDDRLSAHAIDRAGNREQLPHQRTIVADE